MLSDDDVERFVTDGFVPIRSAFDRSVAERCADEIWAHLDADRDDPSSWTEPVVRLPGFGSAPFREAATTATLHEAFDRLVGAGRWVPRDGLGTIPVRFPSPADPGDDGWHVETNFYGPVSTAALAALGCPSLRSAAAARAGSTCAATAVRC